MVEQHGTINLLIVHLLTIHVLVDNSLATSALCIIMPRFSDALTE